MPETKHNLFSALFKWAHGQSENFVTASFAYLLRHLIANDDAHAADFLRQFCCVENECGRHVSLTTWPRTPVGIPDLRIESEQLLVYVEFKLDSGLGFEQLERYRSDLMRRACGRTSRLILISHSEVDLDGCSTQPDIHIRWDHIDRWLSALKDLQPVSQFLVNEFRAFLGRRFMAVAQVERPYVEGTVALGRLIHLLGEAIASESIEDRPKPRFGADGGYHVGYYLDGEKFWVGVYLSDPEVLHFMIYKAKIDHTKLKSVSGWEMYEKWWSYPTDLTVSDCAFFASDGASQLMFVRDWLRRAYQSANRSL